MQSKPDPYQLEIYHEGRKRRSLVGVLSYNPKTTRYTFSYDNKYLRRKQAIPLGPEFPLTKAVHHSKTGQLFPSIFDRIPSKENPAYAEYCYAARIDVEEQNPIVLLGAIGKRGPSTFVFEPIYEFHREVLVEELKRFRNENEISLWDFSAAFDVPYLTMKRIESGASKDDMTMRLINCYLKFPETALWQLLLSGRRVNRDSLINIGKALRKRLSDKDDQNAKQ